MEESKPNLRSARVVEHQKTITNKDSADEALWCTAFVNWVMAQIKRSGTHCRSIFPVPPVIFRFRLSVLSSQG
jgi:hypothetical protein